MAKIHLKDVPDFKLDYYPEDQDLWMDKVINREILAAKDDDELIFPDGDIYIIGKILLDHKRVHLIAEGSDCYVHNFSDEPTLEAIDSRSDRLKIIGIRFVSHYNVNPGEEKPRNCDGLIIRCMHRLEDISILNHIFGIGLIVNGNVGVPTNASFGLGLDIRISSCRKGSYLVGPDTNAGIYILVDVRDNAEEGIVDNSFLGWYFLACGGHANGKGHFHALDANNHSCWVACYGEGDSPPSQMAGAASVLGGFHANGVECHQNASWYRGRDMDHLSIYPLDIDELRGILLRNSIDHGQSPSEVYSTDGLRFEPLQNLSDELGENGKHKLAKGLWPAWKFSFAGYPLLQLICGSRDYPAWVQDARPGIPLVGMNYYFLGKKIIIGGTPEKIKNYPYPFNANEYEFHPGAEIWNDEGISPHKWICIRSGDVFTALWQGINIDGSLQYKP